MNPLISVIITIFNEEKYLEECLDSVINQTLKNIEIICVNDGSTDRTGEILKEYGKKDSRIKIISHENKGPGASRNIGLDIAKGEYIAFLDGDDWLNPEAYEIIYKDAKNKNTDISMFQILNYKEKTGELTKNDWFNLDKFDETFIDRCFSSVKTKDFLFHLSVSACQKIYKNTFLKEINGRFPEGIYFEDNPFFYYVWLKASRISIVKKYLYYRRSHENSITAKVDEKFLDIIPSGKILFKMFLDTGFYEDYKKDLINYTINPYRLTLNSVDGELKENFFKKTKIEFNNINKSKYKDDFLKYMSNANKNIFEYVLKSNTIDEFNKLNNKPKGRF